MTSTSTATSIAAMTAASATTPINAATGTRNDAFSPASFALNYIQKNRDAQNRLDVDIKSVKAKSGKERSASTPLIFTMNDRAAAEYMHPLKNTMTRSSMFVTDMWQDSRVMEARISDGTSK